MDREDEKLCFCSNRSRTLVAMVAYSSQRHIYTMRQKFSNFFNPNCFMIKYANVFDMRFIGRVLHNVTFHDNFVLFSYAHGLPSDVEEIMQITCPAFHVHPMSSKFASTGSYMYQHQ